MTNAIHIDYQGMRPYLQEAVIKVNQLLRNDAFYDAIAAQGSFDMADVSATTIANLMRTTNLEMAVDLYYAMNPVRNTDGYDDLDNPNIIHLNIWRMDRPVASLCNSLVHGCVHAVNARYNMHNFGHGDIQAEGKENTAPYRIGALAQQMIAPNDPVLVLLQHEVFAAGKRPIKDYMPIN